MGMRNSEVQLSLDPKESRDWGNKISLLHPPSSFYGGILLLKAERG